MTAIGYIVLVAVLSTANTQRANEESSPQRVPSRTLQLPRLQNPTPFKNPEISLDLRPPTDDYSTPVVFYEYPTPSRELQVPNLEPWNPNNEQIYYYVPENPTVQSDTEKPTSNRPKKYNKEVHDKVKTANSSPKGGEPKFIDQDGLEQQRKAFERFRKLENKKQLETKKVVVKPKGRKAPEEPLAEASDAYRDVEDISTSFTHSLGVKFPGERFQFHMHGHKGPNSYKWGYDTGKGHNRQFRVEERDEEGFVKGQYGYLDKQGKLHRFDYISDPKGGYTSKKHTGDRK